MTTRLLAAAKALLDAMDHTAFHDLSICVEQKPENGLTDDTPIDEGLSSPLTAGLVRELRAAIEEADAK